MRQRKEIQKMSRRQRVIGAGLAPCRQRLADDQAIWHEFGLADTQTIQQGTHNITAYRMKDPTGALAAWQWQRTADDRACCSHRLLRAETTTRTLINEQNYLAGNRWPAAHARATRHNY